MQSKKTHGRGRQIFKGRTLDFLFEFTDEDVLDEELLPKEFKQALEEVRNIVSIVLEITACSN